MSTGPQPDPKKTVRGLTSGALQILYQMDVQGQGPTLERITIGQVSVTADGGTGTSLAGSRAVGSGSTNSSPAMPGPAGSATTMGIDPIATLPHAASTAPGVTGPTTAGALPRDTVALTQSQSPSGALNNAQLRAEAARMEQLNFSLDKTYWIFVLVGAALLAGFVLSPMLGVRLLPLKSR